MADAAEASLAEHLRTAHLAALTIVGAACLFAFPSEQEGRFEDAFVAAEALEEFEKNLPSRCWTEGTRGGCFDIPDGKPTLDWYDNLVPLDPNAPCVYRFVGVDKIPNAERLLRDPEDAERSANGVTEQPRSSPPTFFLADANAKDNLYQETDKAIEELEELIRKQEVARRAEASALRKLRDNRKAVEWASPKAHLAAVVGHDKASDEVDKKKTALKQLQEEIRRHSAELEPLRGKPRGAHPIVVAEVKFSKGLFYFGLRPEGSDKPRWSPVATCAPPLKRNTIDALQNSVVWKEIYALDPTRAKSILLDEREKARIGGELLGLKLSGADALRWFALPLTAVLLYSRRLAWLTRGAPCELPWLTGARSALFSAGVAASGLLILWIALCAERLAWPWTVTMTAPLTAACLACRQMAVMIARLAPTAPRGERVAPPPRRKLPHRPHHGAARQPGP